MNDHRETAAKLSQEFGKLGWAGKLIPISRLADLQDEIEGRHDLSLFDEEFYRDYLEWFSFSPPEDIAGARSLIIVAVPAPQFRVEFQWSGRPIRLVLPPTYVGYRRTIAGVRDRLNGFLQPEGYRVADSRLPFKVLAARSGLAHYGRNNILYRSGLGSFLQLGAYYSDLRCEGDSWQEPALMERCESCTACVRACPTGAIGPDRFLLRAERCITFHNEREAPLPDWIGTGWYNCLVGCMICQRVCPENRNVIRQFVEHMRFTEEETAQLLDEAHPPAPGVLSKWAELGLSEDLSRMRRNLQAILRHADTRASRKG